MAMKNYIGINGLVIQSLAEIKSDLVEVWRYCYGTDINLEQNSTDGQFLNILAQEKKDTLDLIAQIVANLDPDTAIEVAQDILYKLNGLERKQYTYSYCLINVTTTQAVTLQGLDSNVDDPDGTGYTVSDSNGNRWILAETREVTEAGTYLFNFRAADLGSVTALTNTVNQMETVLRGVSAVNNPANNYITGNTGESSSEYRTRRMRSMAVPSQSFEESVESQLLALTGVFDCKVYNNKTDVEVDGIPPHAVWVIVEGGLEGEIGRVIYNNLPPGIPMKGNTSVLVSKVNGDVQQILYGTATPVNLYVKATIKNFTTTDIDTDFVKQELAKTVYAIGQQAESVNIQTEIKNLIGATGTPYNVVISDDNSTWVEYTTPKQLDGYYVIAVDNITLDVIN